ncbi:MAG: PilN domain-containing protein [Coriobacteriia bacterium]
MMRVNLLPPEITEKRKGEQRLVYVAFAFVAVAILLAALWGFATLRADGLQKDLDAQQQELAQTKNQSEALKIFEDQAAELQRRSGIALLTLEARRNWSKLLDEISLVLPSDVWLTSLSASEEDNLQLDGYAVDADDSPDYGHKSIAKILVRLADLDQLRDVWLGNSVSTLVEDQPAIQFTVTAGVELPSDVASSTPAP